MRIAVVSAHYPPNFTSGGTLIPQRIADGFATRGEDVFVFAGALDHDEHDMATWEETADSGAQITWTVINSMVDWASEDNYRNPRIDAAFAAFLQRVRPDVVHVHNVQAFGGGIVSLAKASGAAVVLTMHDMWWWCARQFLADTTMRPCSPVVSCGVCPCEKDNGWLNNRNRLLAAQLDSVDLVLAPSATMVKLLLANGVDPHRLALDENPAPQPTDAKRPTRRAPNPTDPVRFVYAGGPHPLKGADVTLAAAQVLAKDQGWALDLYGMDLPPDAPDQVTAKPPYAAGDVSAVLAQYDVLLMTSVASESYSLITREALDVGTVVLTGDNPGPTEVVVDGENGLVVPRGDAQALAEAMKRLISDRELLADLAPEPGQITLRSLTDQLDSLAEHYQRLVAAKTESVEAPPQPVRRVLLLTGIDKAPLRYRGRLPQEALADLGVRMDVRDYRDVQVPVLARTTDAVVLYRVPATEQVLDVVDLVRNRPEGVPILFDIDDLIFDPTVADELADVLAHLSTEDYELYWRGVRRYRTTLESADAYIGSTPMLCRAVDELVGIPTHLFANGVGKQLARASDRELRRPRAQGPLRIGYLSGTNTHNEDWAHIEPAVLQVMQDFPQTELWLGGLLETSDALAPVADRIKRIPFRAWHELPAVLRDLDVNLAPLAPGSRFNEAKSAIKWLEAALVQTPTVASPTEPFRADIVDGQTGLLAETTEQWRLALATLLSDPALGRRIGHAAQQYALLEYSPAMQGRRYLDILEQARKHVAAHGHRELFTSWEPVCDCEPFIPVAPEPYEHVGADVQTVTPGEPRRARRVLVDYRINAVNHLRTEGPVRTARKAAQVALRLPRRALSRLR